MHVSLTPELEKLVQDRVESGRYQSANDVIQAALRLLDQHESLQAAHVQELRFRIDEGLAALDRGEGIDGEQFMQKMLEDLDSQDAKRKAG